jgi:hypothetical protein
MAEPVWVGPTTLAEAVALSEHGLRVSDYTENRAYYEVLQRFIARWVTR